PWLPLLGACALLAGCAAPPAPPTGVPAAPPAPRAEGSYQSVPGRVDEVFTLVPARSEIRIRAYRAGRLARLGHNHVVAAGPLEGDVLLARDFQTSRFDLRIPVAGLRLDEPALRAQSGEAFATELSAADIAATRRNMLGPDLLDAARHPQLRVQGRVVGGNPAAPRLAVRVNVRGRWVELEEPVAVALERREGSLIASGRFTVRQTALGLEPFSVMGGALQVRDALEVEFRLVSRRR
ncbi:MAG: YceI family protein, partial [Chromatiales bacterium]